jgi:putative transposase
LKGVVGTTWAPAGQTPLVEHCCKWHKLSTIGGITLAGEVFTQTYSHSICTEQVIAFLGYLAERLPGKLLVIWDGASIHRAKLSRDYLASDNGKRLTLLSLPPYAPECNPIEWLWAWVKKSFLGYLNSSGFSLRYTKV